MINTPPKPPMTLGSIINSFTFKMYQMRQYDQFTIVEDLTISKPIRSVQKLSTKNGNTYESYLIRIIKDGFEADMELMSSELSQIARACPKGTTNFKGVTLAFDGRIWSYVGADTSTYGFQPNVPLNTPVVNQIDQQLKQLVDGIRSADLIGASVNTPILLKIAERITPGDAMGIITYAKSKGAIYEKDGVYKVVD